MAVVTADSSKRGEIGGPTSERLRVRSEEKRREDAFLVSQSRLRAMSLSKILYRDLVHAAKQFDKHASLRALLSSNLLQRPVIHDTNTRLPHIENFNRCVLEYLENRSFYVPSAGKKSLATLVREKYRMAPSAADRMQVDTAFVALKALNDKLAEAQELGVVGYAATTKKSVEGVVSAQQEPNPLVADVQLAE
jgi:hypothetical protein